VIHHLTALATTAAIKHPLNISATQVLIVRETTAALVMTICIAILGPKIVAIILFHLHRVHLFPFLFPFPFLFRNTFLYLYRLRLPFQIATKFVTGKKIPVLITTVEKVARVDITAVAAFPTVEREERDPRVDITMHLKKIVKLFATRLLSLHLETVHILIDLSVRTVECM